MRRKSMNILMSKGAKWIWKDQVEIEINQYIEFKHEFVLDNLIGEDCELFISVDSDYSVWINGKLIGFGQYDDYPNYKVYDILLAANSLKCGKNTLCVLAYYQGASSHQYIVGEPCLIYSLNTGSREIVSG